MANNITQRRDLTRALSFGEMDRNWDELIELINDIHGAGGINERIDALNKESLGLDQVDNTSDKNKPISNATQTALDLKADKSTTQTELNKKVDKANNLSDLPNKSTARSNLGLGTAATRNVGTSNGNVILQEDYGARIQRAQGNFASLDATINSPDAWNKPNKSSLLIDNNNNALSVFVSAQGNERVASIQSGHKDAQYASSLGTLHLNPLGGNVTVNKNTVYHSGNDSTSGVVPKGGIIMWSGSTSNIPSGWALCNGSNGTPDLRGRFVIGAGGSYNPGNTGNGTIPSHNHGVGSLSTNSTGSHSHTGTAASAGNHNHTMSTEGAHSHSVTAAYVGTARGQDGDRWRSIGNTDLRTSTDGNHTHTIWSAGAHTHSVSTNSTGKHTHTISGSTAASGSGSEVIAKYYALCYIMKL